MDFQTIVDSMGKAACIISVEKLDGGSYGELRIVTGNRSYMDTIELPINGVEMLKRTFVPDSVYTDYMPRDLNFEEACYQAAIEKKCIHSYAHPTRYDVWFDMTFVPLYPDNGNICYCLYIMEISFKPDAKRMSAISADIASSVLETCIKLQNPDDFNEALNEVCVDIRDLCDSEHCCMSSTGSRSRSSSNTS
ncbi:MAG: hypothetical protein IKP78_04150 [Ruminococcus sp.]|nr:hypothetical protein [Ruminococcus sp.]